MELILNMGDSLSQCFRGCIHWFRRGRMAVLLCLGVCLWPKPELNASVFYALIVRAGVWIEGDGCRVCGDRLRQRVSASIFDFRIPYAGVIKDGIVNSYRDESFGQPLHVSLEVPQWSNHAWRHSGAWPHRFFVELNGGFHVDKLSGAVLNDLSYGAAFNPGNGNIELPGIGKRLTVDGGVLISQLGIDGISTDVSRSRQRSLNSSHVDFVGISEGRSLGNYLHQGFLHGVGLLAHLCKSISHDLFLISSDTGVDSGGGKRASSKQAQKPLYPKSALLKFAVFLLVSLVGFLICITRFVDYANRSGAWIIGIMLCGMMLGYSVLGLMGVL